MITINKIMIQCIHAFTTEVFTSLDDYSYPPNNFTSNIRNMRLPNQIVIDISSNELANFRLSNINLSISISIFAMITFRVVNTMNFVFFRESLLTFNHLAICLSSLFSAACRISGSFALINRLVSSAKSTSCDTEETSEKSLMYIKNNNGPKIDPCGTQHLTLLEAEDTPSYVTNCFLLAR